ncbi:hypothetical protein [Streptomyces sp. WP-1]|uniref:hypothetical protein n=1 Tax=Streptomyces sp. WP-1 TaxID=3041497 RepID=UPI0026490B74|nr:hypothetical protein [Streptomyces sp. WP-1]WKE67986.1 hypothetical protein QHG49_02575 [Streptomyces sp. WP-1]
MPPMPAGPPPAPPDRGRALAVALLNLSGLGLGYALTRRRPLMAACWVATAVLLVIALPADADGVPGALLAAYALLLLLAAAHGAYLGLRTPLVRPGRVPLALLLGLVLLAVPAGGALWYQDAHDEAVQQALLDRLTSADQLVAADTGKPFGTAEPDYREALGVYHDLVTGHPGSRAARKVPASLRTYYSEVAAPYDSQDHCTAVAPLTYLRTAPGELPRATVGTLAGWPDDRLATSLYACGSQGLSSGDQDWVTRFGDLMKTFPHATQTTKVVPAVDAAVKKAQNGVGGSGSCAAVEELRQLDTRIGDLKTAAGDPGGGLASAAARAGRGGDDGAYDCGVQEYESGDFSNAQQTMDKFVAGHPHHRNRARAQKIAIAAEVAQTIPAAGRKLPTTAGGGSISVTVKNDSPDDVTVLYTGPVTGSFTLKACGGCRSYLLADTLMSTFKPCAGGKDYPQRTLRLPVGTTYFVHKPNGGQVTTAGSDTARLRPGYLYTECAYTTQGFGGPGT